jgi:hypothetical protein
LDFVDVMDKSSHALLNPIDNGLNLLVGAFQDQLDAPVGEVFDVATHVMANRDVSGREAKPDALYPPAEVNVMAMISGRFDHRLGHDAGLYRIAFPEPRKIFSMR